MDAKERMNFVKEFCEVDGISGHEVKASRVMKKYVEGYCDEITYDNLGSIICKKTGSDDVRIMIAGHIDEIGFMVSKIENDGFLRIYPVGGWWPHNLLSQRVKVVTRAGKELIGVVGSIAPHSLAPEQRSKVMDMKQLYVDLGVSGKAEVEELGVRVGDPIIPVSEFTVMANPKYWMCKAFDDRIGAAVGVEVLHNLKGVEHANTVYAVGTVQEEVGLRGARTAAYAVKPDVAIAIDVTIAGDIPGGSQSTKLGGGVAISYGDSSVIGHKGLIALLEDICKEENIPYCFDLLASGGTDSGEIHKTLDGVVTVTLSIPTRYIHAHNGVLHEDDYDATVRLCTALCKRLDRKMVEELKRSKQ